MNCPHIILRGLESRITLSSQMTTEAIQRVNDHIRERALEPSIRERARELALFDLGQEYLKLVAMGAVNIRLEPMEPPCYGFRLVADVPQEIIEGLE